MLQTFAAHLVAEAIAVQVAFESGLRGDLLLQRLVHGCVKLHHPWQLWLLATRAQGFCLASGNCVWRWGSIKHGTAAHMSSIEAYRPQVSVARGVAL